MKRALVTGSNGFVGRHMMHALQGRGYSCWGWDLPMHDARTIGTVGEQFDLVVHLAYNVGGRQTINSSKCNLAANLSLDATMFEWAVRTHQKRVLYFSSSAAYPVRLQTDAAFKLHGSLREEDIKHNAGPDADYGWAKLTGEKLASNAAHCGIKVYVVRPFSGYGEDQSVDYPFRAFVERAKKWSDPFDIWGDETSVRDWIHIRDVVAGALAVVDNDYQNPVNICTGVATSMRQLAHLCMDHQGYEGITREVPGTPYGVHSRIGDPSLFFEFYRPKVTIEEGVRRAFA